jgi:tripartite-type tricarboxylate transporter receptor subunit TctC
MPAFAEAAYPSKTIKMIVPYPARGTTDFLGCLIADQLKTGLGDVRAWCTRSTAASVGSFTTT